MNDNDKLFTITETCEHLRLSRATIHRYITAGQLKSIKFGSRRLIEASAIQAFKDCHRSAA